MVTRIMGAPALASTMFVLGMSNPRSALCQNDQAHRNDCAVIENLKIKESVPGTYTEEATRKNAEGTVVLCLTVDGHGKVTDVSPISGPEQLLQLSMNAARQWEFEPPPKAPAHTQIQMTYSLTKACPEEKGMDQGDIVTTIGATRGLEGDLTVF